MRKCKSSRFDKLKLLMKSKSWSYEDLAYVLNLSPRQVYRLMSGEVDWTLSKIYDTVDFLQIPHWQIAEYFPPDRKED